MRGFIIVMGTIFIMLRRAHIRRVEVPLSREGPPMQLFADELASSLTEMMQGEIDAKENSADITIIAVLDGVAGLPKVSQQAARRLPASDESLFNAGSPLMTMISNALKSKLSELYRSGGGSLRVIFSGAEVRVCATVRV